MAEDDWELLNDLLSQDRPQPEPPRPEPPSVEQRLALTRAAMMEELGFERKNSRPSYGRRVFPFLDALGMERPESSQSRPPRSWTPSPPSTPVPRVPEFPKWTPLPPETCPPFLRIEYKHDGDLLRIGETDAIEWFQQHPHFFHVTFMRPQPAKDGDGYSYWLFDCFEKVKDYKGEEFARRRLKVVFEKMGLKERYAWEGWVWRRRGVRRK